MMLTAFSGVEVSLTFATLDGDGDGDDDDGDDDGDGDGDGDDDDDDDALTNHDTQNPPTCAPELMR